MPDYTYTDGAGHLTTISHPPGARPVLFCQECGLRLRRKYAVPNINWNGLPPSAGEYHPTFQKLFDGAEERRDNFAGIHTAHENRSET